VEPAAAAFKPLENPTAHGFWLQRLRRSGAVREVIKQLELAGWVRYGCGKAQRRTWARHPQKHFQAIGSVPAMSQTFAVVIEEADQNYSAYVPDLPGCVATGASREAVLAQIRAAIAFHLEGLAADAEPQPPLRSTVATVQV